MKISEMYEQAKAKVGLEDTGPVKHVISTGSVAINKASGIGGIPSGRIIEMYGPESSGKTTLALNILANGQKMGFQVAMLDVEHAFDEKYANAVGLTGIKNQDYFYACPDTTEQTVDLVEILIDMGIKVIVVDSVAAMIPKAEAEGEFGESVMGLQARLMSSFMRRIVGVVGNKDVTLILINQIRMKLGVMFGSPETTTGGEAVKFYCSMRIDLRAVGDKIMDGKDQTGRFTKVTFKKNKLAPPLKQAMVPLKYGVGFWKGAELLDTLVTTGKVTKKSSYFYLGDSVLGAGRTKAIEAIEEDIEKFEKLLGDKNGSQKT